MVTKVQGIITGRIHVKLASFFLDEQKNKFAKRVLTSARQKTAKLTMKRERIVQLVDIKNALPWVNMRIY